MRSSHGVIACNGHVLICVQREGAFPEAPESLNKPIEGFGSIVIKDGIRMDDVSLPAITNCSSCGGRGIVFETECEECDGLGEFKHGQHYYSCKECEGEGCMEADTADGANAKPCSKCQGRGEHWMRHAVGNTGFALPYLRMLKELPNCTLHPDGEISAKFQFDGGWGVLMPMRG